MTEFKQIVGRGTRVHEDTKKYYFTLIDFRKATNHFADPDFDGEPVQIYDPGENDPVTPPDNVPPANDEDEPIPLEPADDEVIVDGAPPDISISTGDGGPRKYYIHGDPVMIVAERIEYLDENGKLVTEGLRDYSKKTLRKRFASLDEFLKSWNGTERKDAVIEELRKEGLLFEPLADKLKLSTKLGQLRRCPFTIAIGMRHQNRIILRSQLDCDDIAEIFKIAVVPEHPTRNLLIAVENGEIKTHDLWLRISMPCSRANACNADEAVQSTVVITNKRRRLCCAMNVARRNS